MSRRRGGTFSFADDHRQGRTAAAAETPNVKPLSATSPARLGALAASIALLGGCTVVGDGIFSGDKVDYKSTATKAQPLEVQILRGFLT